MAGNRDKLSPAVLTTGRQDWGLLRPLCERLAEDEYFNLQIFAGGMALDARFGEVVKSIVADGYDVTERLAFDPVALSAGEQSAEALRLTTLALQRRAPDALILLGDRYETAAAALAAAIARVPIVHLYGGDETEGAIDNALRHSITKLSSLHFCSHEVYAQRVLQMGEDPAAVHTVGSTSVDNCLNLPTPGKAELEAFLNLPLNPPLALVTVHPTTLAAQGEPDEAAATLRAIEIADITAVITLPNSDPGSAKIREMLINFASKRKNVVAVESLGEARYLGVLKLASFALGNSSSGLNSAPALGVPTINVGDRQKGRLRSPSIIDVKSDPQEILEAMKKAQSPEFLSSIKGKTSIFGDGNAAIKMVKILKDWEAPNPPRKSFYYYRDISKEK